MSPLPLGHATSTFKMPLRIGDAFTSTRVQVASSNRMLHVGIAVYVNHVEAGAITFTVLPVHSDAPVGRSLRVICGNPLAFQMRKVRFREVQCPVERHRVRKSWD